MSVESSGEFFQNNCLNLGTARKVLGRAKLDQFGHDGISAGQMCCALHGGNIGTVERPFQENYSTGYDRRCPTWGAKLSA